MNIASLCEMCLPETTLRADCPACGGTNSFVISKHDGNVFYRCFKAKCSVKGKKSYVMTKEQVLDRIASKTALGGRTEAKAPFVLPDYWIEGIASKKCFQYLLNANCIDSYLAGYFRVAYDPRQDRLVFLIEDENHTIRGGVGRALSGQLPKTYNYPSPHGYPFTCGLGNTAVLVEDCASACSIGRFKQYTGVALLGTDIREEYFSYVVFNYNKVIIALDKDAVQKSIKIRQQLKYYVDNIKLWKLNKDLKDLSKQEIEHFIKQQSILNIC